jgi:hypothetical protein
MLFVHFRKTFAIQAVLHRFSLYFIGLNTDRKSDVTACKC